MNILETLIAAACVELIRDHAAFVAADRSFDAGEFSSAVQLETDPRVEAAHEVVDIVFPEFFS